MRPAGNGQVERAGRCIIALHAAGGVTGRGIRTETGENIAGGDRAAGQSERDIAAGAVAANQAGAVPADFQGLGRQRPGFEKCRSGYAERPAGNGQPDRAAPRRAIAVLALAALSAGYELGRASHDQVAAATDIDIDLAADGILANAGAAIVANREKIVETGAADIHEQITGNDQSAGYGVRETDLIGVDIDCPADAAGTGAQGDIAVGAHRPAAAGVDIDPVARLQQQILRAHRVGGDDEIGHRRGRGDYAVGRKACDR